MAVSAATQLAIYNDALRLCGEQSLKSLTQEREARHYLDNAWPTAVEYCLEMGLWRFALRAQTLYKSESVTPEFPGFENAFEKPEDILRLSGVYGGTSLGAPLLDYQDAGGYWWAGSDPIYVQYVSKDGDYGGDSNLWTHKFKKFIAAHLALEVVNDIKRDAPETLYQRIENTVKERLLEARSHDAQQDPTRFAPTGSWVRSRGWGGGRDRGSRTRLIG